jgi:hypothetical protein
MSKATVRKGTVVVSLASLSLVAFLALAVCSQTAWARPPVAPKHPLWRGARMLTSPDARAPRVPTGELRFAPGTAGGAWSLPPSAARGGDGNGVASVPDGSGGLYVAWQDFRDGTADVYLQRVTNTGTVASGWPAEGLPICTAVGEQDEPMLWPDGSNGVIIGWGDYRSDWRTADGYGQHVNSSGVALWAANGVKVLTAITGDVAASPDGSGGLLLAWTESNGSDLDVYALRVLGTDGSPAPGWGSSGVLVCGLAEDQASPTIVSDAGGGAIVAWEDWRAGGGETHVFAQRLNASGALQWAANGVQLDAALSNASTPTAVADASAGAIVAWFELDLFGALYAQRVNNSGVVQWAVGGVDLVGGPLIQTELVAIGDGLGGAIVTYADLGPQLRAQRIDPAGDVQWGGAGATVYNGDFGILPDGILPDGAGGAFFVWETRGTLAQDLYAQRLNATGAIGWGPSGAAVCTAASLQQSAMAAPDGSGGIVIAWWDARNASRDVYAQRLDALGAPQLASDGVPVYEDPGVQGYPLAIYDGSGGMWTVWMEKRAGEWDIRARRLGASGAPATQAVPVTVAPGLQALEAAIGDGSGGVIVAWSDESGTTPDLRVQRLDPSGLALWGANGVSVAAPGYSPSPVMTSDGAAGAILAWTDYRNGDADIYAQRVDGTGAVLWTSGGELVCGDSYPQMYPVIAPHSGAGAVVAWADDRSIPGSVYAQLLNGAGAAQWALNGVSITTPALYYIPSGAVSDGADGAIVLFSEWVLDLDTGDLLGNVLRAQRVNGSGAKQWGLTGTVVCDAGGLCLGERIVPHGANGAIVAWTDGRGTTFDLYAQGLSGAGAIQWGANGVGLYTGAGWQALTGLDADGANGAVACWMDERNGYADVYAQRLDASGAALWTSLGVPVCGEARGQFAGAVATDGAGAGFFAWTDNRAGNERLVYAQRVSAAGSASWLGNGVTSTLVSLASAEAGADRVRITWLASAPMTATVYRRGPAADWTAIGEVAAGDAGLVVFEDRDVARGARYGYRLGVHAGGSEVFAGEVWVEIPARLELALAGLRPNPAVSDLVVAFTLATSAPARLEMLDLTGRRVLARELPGLDAGNHTLVLDRTLPPSGVYFLKLTQGGRAVTARAVVMP